MTDLRSTYLGAYLRIGRTPTMGPMFRIRRYDPSRMTWTVQSLHFDTESPLSHAELERGLAEGILHVIGKSKVDS